MRFLSKALLGMLPVAMLGISAASAATPGWKHTCEGPSVACSSAEPVAAAQMTMRVGTNTLFGIVGLFDVASDLGIERS